jgi:hypothetical protein
VITPLGSELGLARVLAGLGWGVGEFVGLVVGAEALPPVIVKKLRKILFGFQGSFPTVTFKRGT